MDILLRFRETNDYDTISEHQKIIEEYGYVWWGWWKKESEPNRVDFLSEIKNNIGKNQQFWLFDRSSQRSFKIEVAELSFGNNEKSLSPEIDKTPRYYNDKELPLWLKLKSFKSVPFKTFTESFKLLPTEDYTFFTEIDLKQDYLEITESNSRTKLKSDYILHLSDIHFGVDFGFPHKPLPGKRPLLDILSDYVNHELKSNIGLLIISGDITSRGSGDILLSQGLDFLNKLCATLDISKECVVIIPGNHDIPLKDADFGDYNHENLFRLFLEQFYGIKKDPFGLDFFEFPCGKKIDLLKIHSVKLRKKEESNYGYVDWSLYNTILSSQYLDGDLKIAVMHHHLVSMQAEEMLDADYPFAGMSVTIDSGRVIEGLQKNKFDFVLNGHQHLPGIIKINRGFVNNSNLLDMNTRKDLTILSAGSVGVKDGRFSEYMKYNSFSIYQMKSDSLEVEVLAFNSSMEPKRHYNSTLKL